MKTRIKLHNFLCLFLFTSCFKSTKESRVIETCIPIDSLVISLDEKSVPEFNYHQIGFYNEDENLIVLNQINQSLDFYSLTNGEPNHRIQFQPDGPDRVSDISGFFYHNKDSIFLFPKMTFKNTKLINIEGNIERNYVPEISFDQVIKGLINHLSTSYNPTYYFEGNLYFDQALMKNPSISGVLSDSFETSGKLDLNSETVFLFENSKFPHFYKDKPFPIYVSISSRILNSNAEWVYSWNALDSILVFDIEMKSIGSFSSKSRFKKTDFPQTPNAGFIEELEAVISNTHYCKLIYDPYRKNYLRFVQIGRSYDPEKDNTISAVFKNDFSIMIYDENFEFVDEIAFEGSKYNFYHAFVGEKGVHLPKSNPYYLGFSEDQVVIDIFLFQ